MKVTDQDVEQLALQSRLDLKEEEKTAYARYLNTSLDYLDILKKLDTTGVEPAGHVLPIRNVFREDKLEKSLEQEEALRNAPEKEEGCFVVPRIV